MLVNELHNNDSPGRAGLGWAGCHLLVEFSNFVISDINTLTITIPLFESLKVLIFHKSPVNEDVCGQESNVKD